MNVLVNMKTSSPTQLGMIGLGRMGANMVQELDDVAQRCPAEHYVTVEDKLRLLTAIKSIWGRRVTTVFVRQGHYALDPNILSDYPAPDIGVERIGDLLDYELPDFTSSAIAHQEKEIS